MADALEQVLLELGLDLSPVKESAKVISATMADLNKITDQYQSRASAAGEAQLSRVRQLAQAAVQGATAAIAEEKKKQAVLESQTVAIEKQIAQQRLSVEATNAGVGAEQKKLLLLEQQTEARKRELVELRKLTFEERRRINEENRLNREQQERGAMRSGLARAVFGRGALGSAAASVAGGVIGGELIVQMIEGLVEKLKEVGREAGAINLLQDQFEKLARGAGVDANKMLTEMQEHTEGLVDRFKILQTASAALKSSLVAPEKVAEAMGAVVRLSEAQGKSAEQGITALNRALLTGRGNALAMATGLSILQTRLTNLPQGLTATQRGSMQLNATLDLIIKKSKELGEMPQTFEQMEKRINVALKDISTRFGQGLNEAPGTQVFLRFFNLGAKQLEDFSKTAERWGRNIGNALGVAVPILQTIGVLLRTLWNIIGDIVKTWGTFLGLQTSGSTAAVSNIRAIGNAFLSLNVVLDATLRTLRVIFDVMLNLAGPLVATSKVAEGATKGNAGMTVAGMGQLYMSLKEYGPKIKEAWDENFKDFEKEWGQKIADFNLALDKAEADAAKGRIGAITGGGGDQKTPVLDRQLSQALLQARQALAKQRLEYRKEEIQEERNLDNQAYQQGEEDLETHQRKQLELARRNLQAQRALAKEQYDAELANLKEQQTIREKQYTEHGAAVPKEVAETFKLQQQRLLEQYTTQWLSAGRQFEQEKTNIQKQGDADRSAAALKAVSDQLAAEKESIQTRKQLLEKAFGQQQLDPNAYYQQRIELIHAEALAEIQAANQTYAAKEHNEKSLAELKASIRAAEQKGQDQIDQLYADKVRTTVSYLEKASGGKQTLAQAQFGVFGQLGQTQNQQQVAQGAIQSLEQQREQLERMLPLAMQLPELYNEISIKLQNIISQQIQWAQELQKTTTSADKVGTGLGTIGTGLGEVFHQRFMQNLSQTIGASTVLFNPVMRAQLQQGMLGQDVLGNRIKDPMDRFIGQITSSAQALTAFASAISTARTAVTGGIGGAISGAGFGETIGGAIGKIAGLGANAGPWGAVGGAVVGSVLGVIVGGKQQKVKEQIDHLNYTFKTVMTQFAENTNNLQATINQLEGLIQQAREMQASSKKGSSQFQDVINQYLDQLRQLQVQQVQVLRQMHQQIAILQEPAGAQSYLSDLKQILDQYQQFEGAAKTTQDLADATQYLTEAMQNYEVNLQNQLLQDNQQAINDALQLNDLLWQRNQMTIEYNQQVSQILSQGVLTRQMTRAQTAGTQIYLAQQQYIRQKEQLDEQINATNYRVQAEQQIFNMATTRVGLETQLLQLQNQQTNYDMLRIAALSALIAQLQSGNLNAGALGAMLSSLQGVMVNVPGASGTDIFSQIAQLLGNTGTQSSAPSSSGYTGGGDNGGGYTGGGSDRSSVDVSQFETLIKRAYQNRASLGYGAFRAQNL